MKQIYLLVLSLFLVCAWGGCRVRDQDAKRGKQGNGAVPFAELKERMKALEERLGPDAYGDPETLDILRQSLQVPSSSPDRIEAEKLAERIKAKRRILHQVLEEPTQADTRPLPPSHAPRPVVGVPPSTREAIARAEGSGVGLSREDLLARYGSCLVRQTWIRGTNGGPTIELFQVEAACRDKLKPRIFEVADARVRQVSPGSIDNVMHSKSKDDSRRPKL